MPWLKWKPKVFLGDLKGNMSPQRGQIDLFFTEAEKSKETTESQMIQNHSNPEIIKIEILLQKKRCSIDSSEP